MSYCLNIPTSVLLLFGSMLFTMGLYNVELVECMGYLGTKIHTKILTFDMSTKMMDLFWTGSYIYTFAKYRCGKLASTFPLIHSFVESIHKRLPNLSGTPTSSYPWGCITRLYRESNGNLIIREDLFDFTEFEWKDRTSAENLSRLKLMAKQLMETDTEIQECLVLMALSETAIVSRVVNASTPEHGELDKIDTPSQIKIFVPDYMHPDIDDCVELEVSPQYNIVGNQILSAAFIGRLLKNQTNVFDDKYLISMLDKQMNMNKLTYRDYIKISESNYTIGMTPNIEMDDIGGKLLDNTQSQTNEDDESKSWDKIDTLVAEAQTMLQ